MKILRKNEQNSLADFGQPIAACLTTELHTRVRVGADLRGALAGNANALCAVRFGLKTCFHTENYIIVFSSIITASLPRLTLKTSLPM